MDYQKFLDHKKIIIKDSGFKVNQEDLSAIMFEYQKDIVKWALKRGRAAIFTGTGSGKTIMQLEYARKVHDHTRSSVLILCPLAVGKQTIQEGKKKLKMTINDQRLNGYIPGINILNYEQLDNIDPSLYGCIILDESSILKSFSGKIRNQIIDMFAQTPYKLACTATPSPNDFMELGNHSEFLNVMRRSEMLSMYFVHDGENTQEWRLKGHAQGKFWEWVSQWAVVMRNPEDIGYKSNYQLPKLETETIIIDKNITKEGSLFSEAAQTLDERRLARKTSIDDRVEVCADIANSTDEMYLVWCDYNQESVELSKNIKGAYEITGSDDDDYKEKTMLDFANGDIRCVVSKGKIAGFGVNWQACHNIIYCGLSDSFEKYYQSVRRCYRYGQKHNVKVWIVITSAEIEVLKNIQRKEKDFNTMMDAIVKYTAKHIQGNLHIEHIQKTTYNPTRLMKLPEFLRSEL